MTIYDILKDSSNGGNWKIIDINKWLKEFLIE